MNELLEGAVITNFGGFDIDEAVEVDGTAVNIVAGGLVGGKGFAGHDGLVGRAFAANNCAVNGNGFAGANTKDIANLNITGVDHNFLVPNKFAAPGGGHINKVFEGGFGVVGGNIFQNGAYGHNESNLTGGEEITDGGGGNHGDGD